MDGYNTGRGESKRASAEQILRDNGIRLDNYELGQHYSTCPRCSHKRKHKSNLCLSVKIDDEGACWKCHQCYWSGPEKSNGHDRRPAHVYHDASGVERFGKVRNAPGREPRFWLVQPDGKGGWRKGVKGVDTTILYRIDEVTEAIALGKAIAVVEGEKDADRLWLIGIPATCNAHGAAPTRDADGNPVQYKPKWYRAHSEQLRGADIVVLNDNDEQGYKHADAVRRMSVGVANSIRRLDLALHWAGMPDGNDISDWIANGGTREQLDELIAAAPAYSGSEVNDGEPNDGFPVVHWQGETDELVTQPWLIAGLLPEVGTGLISGQWGTFKTFAAIDLAGTLASGGTFLDYPVCRQGGTLFIATEGSFQIPIRVKAVLKKKFSHLTASKPAQEGIAFLITQAMKQKLRARGVTDDEIHKMTPAQAHERLAAQAGKIPFAWIDSCPSLLDPDGVKQIIAGARKIDEKMRADFGVPLVEIMVDTVVNAAGFAKAGDENDNTVGAALMQALTEIAKQTRTFVVGIDHFGKAVETGTRGASAKEAGADVVLALLGEKAVSGKVTNTRLAIRKNRAGESGREFPFTAPVVEMGHDQFGLPVTTRIIEWGREDRAPAEKTDNDWTGPMKLLRRTLMSVLTDRAGVDYTPAADGPTVRAADLELVRRDFYKGCFTDGNQAAKQKAFKRAVNAAQQAGLVGTHEDDFGRTLIWFVRREDAQGSWDPAGKQSVTPANVHGFPGPDER